MEDTIVWTIGLFIVLFVAIIVIAIYFGWRQNKTIKTLLGKEAQKRNGQVNKKWGTTELVFPYHDLSITVSSTLDSESSPPQTEVATTLGMTSDDYLKISRKSILSRISRSSKVQTILSGNNEFDARFTVKGTDENLIKRLVSFELQREMLLLEKYNPRLILRNNRLSLSIFYIPNTEEEYDQVIEAMLLVIDKLEELKKIL